MRTFLLATSYDSFITQLAQVLGEGEWSFFSTSTTPILQLLTLFSSWNVHYTLQGAFFATAPHHFSSHSIYDPDSLDIFWY